MAAELPLGYAADVAVSAADGRGVGRDVWCETNAITEFDVVKLGDRCVVNRHGICRRTVPRSSAPDRAGQSWGGGSTLGPISAMLPDTAIGAGCSVGGRSVVMRGERLPAGTRWHGAPVVAASPRDEVGGKNGSGSATAFPRVRILDAREAALDEPGAASVGAGAETESAAAEGFVTRSYRYPYAMVARHSRPVGIDIERFEAM